MIAWVVLLAAALDPARCLPAGSPPAADEIDPLRAPDPRATALNAAGKTLYRQGRWDEARAQYRAAEAADPGFLAPRLNVACSFVRQDRFSEAVAEVEQLVARAYVPWAREVEEAADLGALKPRPEARAMRAAFAAAAATWGAGVDDGVVFVARQRPPLRVPAEGAGVFVLNPHQEVYAFLPATGRVRQLTAEDGHVVAAARTVDGRRVAYVTAEQWVRHAGSGELALRGVTLGELTTATMGLAPRIRLEGEIRTLEILGTRDGVAYRIAGDRTNGGFVRGADGQLVPWPGAVGEYRTLASLTARGVRRAARIEVGRACPVAARDVGQPSGLPAVVVSSRGRPPRKLGAAYGAGLVGLPLP